MERTTKRDTRLNDDPLWYKDAIVYQLHVRAFCDGDGAGHLGGLGRKLDYLHDPGITAIWLLPFSPLGDDGYDIPGYRNIHQAYGTLDDFKAFLDESHRRESQKRSEHSLLAGMKQIVRVRESRRVFSRGSIEFLTPANHRMLTYIRQLGEDQVLIANHLSSSAQNSRTRFRSLQAVYPDGDVWREYLSPGE